MVKGITANGKHSYYSFGLRVLKSSFSPPPKDDHTERVPYSNITYDFSSLYSKSYAERTLKYKLEFMELDERKAADRIVNILNWLHWSGQIELRDEMLPGYYFKVREPEVLWSMSHGIYTFDVTFSAAPAMLPEEQRKKLNKASVLLPDVDLNGTVDAADATAIVSAYSAISTGQDPGLTEEQLKRADADRSGAIEASDASLVMTFYNKLATGSYEGLTLIEAWIEFLKEYTGETEEVIY